MKNFRKKIKRTVEKLYEAISLKLYGNERMLYI